MHSNNDFSLNYAPKEVGPPLPANEPRRRSSLYPSRVEVEAVRIPDCHDVFQKQQLLKVETSHGKSQQASTQVQQQQQQRFLNSLLLRQQRSSSSSSFRRDSTAACPSAAVAASLEPRRSSSWSSGGYRPYRNGGGGRENNPHWRPPRGSSSSSRHDPFATTGAPHKTPTGTYSIASLHSEDGSSSLDRKPSAKVLQVEVAPGWFLPLHGSQATRTALVRNETFCLTRCATCQSDLYCVPQAAHVLCPDCRVVSPVLSFPQEPYSRGSSRNNNQPHGVGLGLSQQEYDQWSRDLSSSASSLPSRRRRGGGLGERGM